MSTISWRNSVTCSQLVFFLHYLHGNYMMYCRIKFPLSRTTSFSASKLDGSMFCHSGKKKSKDWEFHNDYMCTACHSWLRSASLSCLAYSVLSLHSTCRVPWGQAGTVLLFNEAADNGLWRPRRAMTQIAMSSDWD